MRGKQSSEAHEVSWASNFIIIIIGSILIIIILCGPASLANCQWKTCLGLSRCPDLTGSIYTYIYCICSTMLGANIEATFNLTKRDCMLPFHCR